MKHARRIVVMAAVMALMSLASPAHAAVPAEACLARGGAVIPDASAPKGASCLGGEFDGQDVY